MNKKVVITLVILGVLIAGILVANNVVGNKVATSVDNQLQTILNTDSLEIPFEFEYESVSSNPIGGAVTIHNFKIVSREDLITPEGEIKATSIELSMPLAEILAIMNDKELQAINKMSISMVDPRVVSQESEITFEADYLTLEYDGELSLFELEKFEKGILPGTKQAVAFRAKGMKLEAPADMLELADQNPAMAEFFQGQFNQKSDFDFSIAFDPYKKTLTLEEVASENGFSDMHGQGQLIFTGETVEDFTPQSGDFEMAWEASSFEQKQGAFGKISLDKASGFVKADFEMEEGATFPEDFPAYNLEYNASVKGAEFELGQEFQDMAMQSGLPLSSGLELRSFELDFKKKGNKIDLNRLKIDMKDYMKMDAYFHLQADGSAQMDGLEDLEDLKIESAKVELSNLAEPMLELVEMLEMEMPKPFPREGDKIVIEVYGSMSDPKIKGVTD